VSCYKLLAYASQRVQTLALLKPLA